MRNNYWVRFCDIRNNQGRGKEEADNTYRDLDYSGSHKKQT